MGVAPKPNVWWQVAHKYKLAEILKDYPDLIVYGEVYGPVQKGFTYDTELGEVKLAGFDIYSRSMNKYLDYDEFQRFMQEFWIRGVTVGANSVVTTTPVLYRGPWNEAKIWELTKGMSTLNKNHIKEGVVVKPVVERYERGCGRVIFKMISEAYRLKKDTTEYH